jgi:hypothetical protein
LLHRCLRVDRTVMHRLTDEVCQFPGGRSEPLPR